MESAGYVVILVERLEMWIRVLEEACGSSTFHHASGCPGWLQETPEKTLKCIASTFYDLEMSSPHTLLYNLLSRKYDFCCLCLKIVEDKKIHVQDEIVINKNEPENTVKIPEILAYVLGEETYDTISGFDVLCKQCTRSAVNSYKFIAMAKENSDFLAKSVHNLASCLEDTGESFRNIKTMFLTFDTNDLSCQKYFDSKRILTSSTALKRLSSIFQSNIERKTENKNIKVENEINEPYKRSKRKHYAYSVAMKTSEMLYNKDDLSILQCKNCLKVYPALANLRNHYIRVHAPKTHKCPTCSRKFGSLALLDAHQNDSHCTIVCKECGKTFYNRHTLKKHEVSHFLKLVCIDCGRTYRSRTTFKKHKELNICGQKSRASQANAKFTCDYCNKKYTQKVSLRVHIQYEHGDYKSHECKWCKKKFWAQSRLKAHIVKHTQEKKFACTICGGKFVSKESLLYHTRTHTGEKPYKCKFCDNRFLSASRRADHTKRHHTNAIFQCKLCRIKYTTKVCFQQHMKSHANLSSTDFHSQSSNKQGNIPKSEDAAYFLSDDEEYSIDQEL